MQLKVNNSKPSDRTTWLIDNNDYTCTYGTTVKHIGLYLHGLNKLTTTVLYPVFVYKLVPTA